jgi:hypothetical protein
MGNLLVLSACFHKTLGKKGLFCSFRWPCEWFFLAGELRVQIKVLTGRADMLASKG